MVIRQKIIINHLACYNYYVAISEFGDGLYILYNDFSLAVWHIFCVASYVIWCCMPHMHIKGGYATLSLLEL